jgi:hypothetical protein
MTEGQSALPFVSTEAGTQRFQRRILRIPPKAGVSKDLSAYFDFLLLVHRHHATGSYIEVASVLTSVNGRLHYRVGDGR